MTSSEQPPPEAARPLYWPEGRRPPEDEPAVKLIWLAMGGALLAAGLHRLWWLFVAAAAFPMILWLHGRNGQPSWERIAEQLRERSTFPVDAWGSPERAALAQLAASAIAREVGWPNGNFIPDDPAEIVFFWPKGDGAQGLAVFVELEKTTKRRWRWCNWKTFGELIDANLPGAQAKTARPN